MRNEGSRSLWFRLLAELGYRRALVLERPLTGVIPDIRRAVEAEIGLLEPSRAAEYASFRGIHPATVAKRFLAGHRCYVARERGALVSASWAARDRAWSSYLKRELQLAADEVYVYDSFTAQAARGRSLSPAVRARMLRDYRLEGCRRMILVVRPENRANLRAVSKLGFQPCGRIVVLGRWSWEIPRRSSGRPR